MVEAAEAAARHDEHHVAGLHLLQQYGEFGNVRKVSACSITVPIQVCARAASFRKAEFGNLQDAFERQLRPFDSHSPNREVRYSSA